MRVEFLCTCFIIFMMHIKMYHKMSIKTFHHILSTTKYTNNHHIHEHLTCVHLSIYNFCNKIAFIARFFFVTLSIMRVLDSDSFSAVYNKQLLFYGIYDVMFYGEKINKNYSYVFYHKIFILRIFLSNVNMCKLL